MVASSVYVNESVRIIPNPYALSIKPRLEYCSYLVEVILEKFQKTCEQTRQTNLEFYSQKEDLAKSSLQFRRQVQVESNLICAIEILKTVKVRLQSITQINNIAENISPIISVIRIINSNVHSCLPQSDHDLIELSTTFGSIVMDSGCLSEAKFDFKKTNLESTRILAEVNLIVESKIRTQYPNLNF